ncbi:MAG: hypothetical protein IT339_01520 [Thermomicrobiales bacterium]|nr:hypothetical protein [Thermomicrobiales bacterium]
MRVIVPNHEGRRAGIQERGADPPGLASYERVIIAEEVLGSGMRRDDSIGNRLRSHRFISISPERKTILRPSETTGTHQCPGEKLANVSCARQSVEPVVSVASRNSSDLIPLCLWCLRDRQFAKVASIEAGNYPKNKPVTRSGNAWCTSERNALDERRV